MYKNVWETKPLGTVAAPSANSFVDGPFGSNLKMTEYSNEGVRLIQLQNIGDGYWVDDNKKFIPEHKFLQLIRHAAYPGDIAIAKMAEPVARACLLPMISEKFLVVADCIKLTPDPSCNDSRFLVYIINHDSVRRQAERKSIGTTRQRINLTELKSVLVQTPPLIEQQRIAAVLKTVDTVITHTETLIAKLKAIRFGLLHDLLTCGLDPNGELRDPVAHPEQFEVKALGLMPKEWKVCTLKGIVASAVDGPFGSNLKTEHYVSQFGVRVVRLQNIGSGIFEDEDKAYIDYIHANRLGRHQVCPNDLIVASLGDDNHPIARACLYPDHLAAGIVKADCFRLRLQEEKADHRFFMYVLNTPITRTDIGKLAQGVTRDRINLTTLLQIRVRLPPIEEQKDICRTWMQHDARLQAEKAHLDKLYQLKQGLMNDLLTGQVRTTELEIEDYV